MTTSDESPPVSAAAAAAEREGARPDGGVGLWRRAAFRRYLVGESASLAGSAVSSVAVPTLAVVDLGASSGQIALLAFAGQLPAFVAALPAGALADRHRKRPLMITGDLVCAVAVTVIPVAAALGVLSIGYVYAVAVLLGTAKVVHDAAAISYLPALVEPRVLHRANSRLSAVFAVADSTGSNAGAALVGALGAARSVLADAVSYTVSAWCVWRIRTPEHVRRAGPRRRLRAEIWEGLAYSATHPVIRSVIAAISAATFAQAVISTYWAFFLLTRLHYSPAALGVVMGVANAGSLAGALLAPWLARRTGPGPVMIAMLLVLPLAQIPLLMAQPGRRWQFALAAGLVIQMFAVAACGTTQRSVRQMICEPRFQGRMQQASTWLTAGARPFAALTAGALAAHAGVRPVLCLGAVLLLAPAIILFRSPVRTLRTLPEPPPVSLPTARDGTTDP